MLAVGCVSVGVLSHLLLDLLPHCAWIVYLDWFRSLPYHWLLREGVFGLAVAVPALLFAGKARPFVLLGIAGGVYPDIEKVLALDLHVPDAFILFEWHSKYLSSRTAGLPKPVLIIAECMLILGFLAAMWRMGQKTARPDRE